MRVEMNRITTSFILRVQEELVRLRMEFRARELHRREAQASA